MGRGKSTEVKGLFRKKTRNDRAARRQKAKGRRISQDRRRPAESLLSALRDLADSLPIILEHGLQNLLRLGFLDGKRAPYRFELTADNRSA
jgi:hypothetical protein